MPWTVWAKTVGSPVVGMSVNHRPIVFHLIKLIVVWIDALLVSQLLKRWLMRFILLENSKLASFLIILPGLQLGVRRGIEWPWMLVVLTIGVVYHHIFVPCTSNHLLLLDHLSFLLPRHVLEHALSKRHWPKTFFISQAFAWCLFSLRCSCIQDVLASLSISQLLDLGFD